MNKIIYVAFLAIATVKEIGEIFLFPPNGLIEILYIIGFLYVIIKMLTDSLPLWIWRNGYSIVGFSAMLYLILRFFGIPNQPIDVFDSMVCLFVWLKSLIYLNNYKEISENESI
jgi:hypothetical protein